MPTKKQTDAGDRRETTVVNISYDTCDVYIGRPRRGDPWYFGNPFEIGKDGNRAEVIGKFQNWFLTGTDPRAVWMRVHINELRGKKLGCFCAPQMCHGDLLAHYADCGLPRKYRK